MKCATCKQRAFGMLDWYDVRRKFLLVPKRVQCQPCGARMRVESPAHRHFVLAASAVLALALGLAAAIGAYRLEHGAALSFRSPGSVASTVFPLAAYLVYGAITYRLARYVAEEPGGAR